MQTFLQKIKKEFSHFPFPPDPSGDLFGFVRQRFDELDPSSFCMFVGKTAKNISSEPIDEKIVKLAFIGEMVASIVDLRNNRISAEPSSTLAVKESQLLRSANLVEDLIGEYILTEFPNYSYDLLTSMSKIFSYAHSIEDEFLRLLTILIEKESIIRDPSFDVHRANGVLSRLLSKLGSRELFLGTAKRTSYN